jgi:hypothetical protein
MNAETTIVIVILPTVVFIFRAIPKYIVRKANFVKEVTEHTGPKISTSGWRGCADINGIYFKNSIKVIRYEQGYMLKLFPIWGSGKLWVPKNEMEIIEQTVETLFTFSKSVSINSRGNAIV